MILVDIYVPCLDKVYDFHLDETAKVQIILDEIVEMIGHKEHTTLYGGVADLTLYDRLERRPLPVDMPLGECGIHSGSSMLLV